jgi:transcriptional regulator with XRE-family HTH domain
MNSSGSRETHALRLLAPTSIGARLRLTRERRGLSQRMLAYRLGRDHCMVSRWESDQREPTLFDLARVARVLRTTVTELVEGVELSGSTRRWSSRASSPTRRAELGTRWAEARRAHGMTLWDLYRDTGIAGRRLRRIEEGADAGVAEAIALAAALRVDLDELLSRSGLTSRGSRTEVSGQAPIARVVPIDGAN